MSSESIAPALRPTPNRCDFEDGSAENSGQEYKTIHANGIRFAYIEEGSGPLVLCLHGFPSNAYTFREQIRALARNGFRAVAPFLRGHFPTSCATDNNYRNVTLGYDAIHLIRALGYDAAVIMGHDWGSGAAYAAALIDPSRVRSIIAISGPYGTKVSTAFQSDILQLQRAWHIYLLQSPVGAEVLTANDCELVEFLWRSWSPTWSFSGRELAEAKETFRMPGAAQAASLYYRSMFTPPSGIAESQRVERDYGRKSVPAPTLYIAGGNDGVLPPNLSDGMESHFPNGLRKEIVPNAGHFPHQEQPARVNRLLLEFLACA